MKWIRWDGNGHFDTRNDKPASMIDENYSDTFTDSDIVCEKDTIWREIASGTLNLEDGKWHVTLKPLSEPENVPTLLEAAKAYFIEYWGGFDTFLGREHYSCSGELIALAEAVKRDEKKPASPYTKEAVDEFLMSCIEYPTWLTEKDRSRYWCGGATNMWEKIQVLLRQREAANV